MSLRSTLVVASLFLLGTGQVFSQEEKSAAPASRKADTGNALHRAYLDSARMVKTTDLKKSIDFITQSIAVLDERGNEQAIAASLTTLGELYRYHGQLDLAISNLEEARKLSPSVATDLELARAYVATKAYARGESLLLQLRDSQDLVPYQRILVYELMGDARTGQDQIDAALGLYKEALKIAEENQVMPKITDLNSKIADTYARANRREEARAYYDNSLELSSKQAPARAVREKEKVADFYNNNREYEQEIALRKKSLDVLKEQPVASEATKALEDEEGEGVSAQEVAFKIANAYIAQEQLDEALLYLQESIAEADANADLMMQKEATRALSEVYRRKGDFNRALESYQDYVTLVDSIYQRKEKELASIAQFNREIAEKQSRITGLEQERALASSRYELAMSEQDLIQERSRRQQWLIYSLIVVVLLMGLTAYFFYRSNRQQKLANNLLALKSLRTQMNPHFIFNALNSVNQFIASHDERAANRYLSEFSQLMRSVLEHSEQDFIPLSDELKLLQLYVKLEHTRFPDKFDYEILVQEDMEPEIFSIPPMLLQPFVENAIWHGLRYKEDRGYLKIYLGQSPAGKLRIEIEDNGIGRTRSAELKTKHQKMQRSQGMENISKRIRILNDMYAQDINVEVSDLKANGGGTRVVLTLNNKA